MFRSGKKMGDGSTWEEQKISGQGDLQSAGV